LKVKEPEKTYPIELKRRSLKDSLEFFIDKHDRGNLSTENLIEMIISRFENEPIKHPNAIGFDKCRNCGGTGHLKIHPGISGVVICPKCHGTGIQKKG
jgi:Ribonuclease G/E